MKNTFKRAGILLVIFIIAVAGCFMWAHKTVEKSPETVYTSLEEASLPVVYAEMYGRKMNRLHGNLQDMRQAARAAVTVIPEDRRLTIEIDEYGSRITGIRYEIRTPDLERLVERTTVENWTSDSGTVTAALPIQNLLSKGEYYLLDIAVDTAEAGEIHYYTRIQWTDNAKAEEMIQFAVDFSSKTFDYNQAKELVTYLETNNTEDNTSLGRVTIRSSFDQLTWGGTGMQPMGGVSVTLKELDGIMSEVQLNYLVSRTTQEGESEIYEAEDHFTMKWSAQRIYLMNYSRDTNQIFTGGPELFSGKRILLGITNDDEIHLKKSDDGNQIAFVANRDLWRFDQKKGEAVKVFSFRSGEDDGVRSGYDQHDIRIAGVENSGDMDFLVYGYMNRGNHEGRTGVALYRYEKAADSITEKFFVPASRSYELLKQDLEQLARIGDNDLFYMLVDHAVYGIDLNSNEYVVVADTLREGGYAVGQGGKKLAWQDSGDTYGSGVIHLMDLETGKKQEITGGDGELLRVLGFVGSDFICGVAREGERWMENGRMEAVPMYAVEILGEQLQLQTRYEKEGLYISSVEVQGSRIRLNRVARQAEEQFVPVDEDTLVCNDQVDQKPLDGFGWYASADRKKVYFVQLDAEQKSGGSVHISAPGKVTAASPGALELKANASMKVETYYAYGGGKLMGTSETFSNAVNMAYGEMGLVTDEQQNILWNRVSRGPSRTIKEPQSIAENLLLQLQSDLTGQEADYGVRALDARGCSLSQMLYFVDRGCPVVAYTGEGTYSLIMGFDQYNITLMNPSTGGTSKMGINDAGDYFKSMKNDFICGIVTG